MAKAMEPFSDSQVVLGSPGPGPMYRLNPPSPPPLIGQPYSYLHESLLINARLCAQRDITGEAFVHCDIYNRRLHRWCNGQRARLECGRSWGSCSDRVYQTHEYISCHFPTWIQFHMFYMSYFSSNRAIISPYFIQNSMNITNMYFAT